VYKRQFLNRLWRQITAPPVALPPAGAERPESLSKEGEAALRAAHKTIKAVSEDIDRFHFNGAVARARELSNALAGLSGEGDGEAHVLREGYEVLVRLLNPMMPHITEELWRGLGHETMLVDTPWPEADPALIVDEAVSVAVQVNGKLRGQIELPRDAANEDAERAALANDNVKRAIEGKTVRKVIVVPNRIVNIVA